MVTSKSHTEWRATRWIHDQYLCESTAYRALKDAGLDGKICPTFHGCFRLSKGLFRIIQTSLCSSVPRITGYNLSDLDSLFTYGKNCPLGLVRAMLLECIDGVTVTDLHTVAQNVRYAQSVSIFSFLYFHFRLRSPPAARYAPFRKA